VLPTRIPNLLINGSSGIAVGMATNIPPHNLGEIVSACIALIENPELTLAELMQIVPGPDFPTAGLINGAQEIVAAYKTGRGRLHVRARTHVEDVGRGDRQAIVITELPYQVNKARLIERIADLVREKQIEGIASDGLRDESDKDGMRVVIELKRGEVPEILLNNLFAQTPMEQVFGINMVALVDGQPQLLTLKRILEAFVRHRREVVTRRTLFELREARKRAHVLEGLTVALANIDAMIELIKTSESGEVARQRMLARHWEAGLVRSLLAAAGADASKPEDLPPGVGLSAAGYQLSEVQAQQILEMRLAKLTGLEQEKLTDEYKELLTTIEGLLAILMNADKLLTVIREELAQIRAQYGDARRTVIQASQEDLDVLDLIAAEDVVVTLSHAGYAKRQPVTTYRAQRRGGRGRSATNMKEEDFVERLWIANTHDTLLAFTSAGRVLWLKVHQIPDASPGARGKPIVNLLPLEEGERVQAVLPVREFPDDRYVFFATRKGTVKKTPLSDYSRPRSTGIRAIDIDEGDGLVDVSITDGKRDVFLFASNGKAVRFSEGEVRPMGRTAHGVRGIRLAGDAQVVSMIVAEGEGDILTATAHGFGKRTELVEYPRKGRGTQGVIAIQCSERNGNLVGAVQLDDAHELMLISNLGTLVRTRAAEVARVGRNTQGVTLIRLPDEEALVGVVRVEALNGDDEGDAVAEEASQPTA
ncbi:MAG: DNA gyrase subunit A, partial [Xanthomonadaceae bacterium]|nr:DNA gyrase subunit A [Xanthomonadaceae bacterium]